MRVGSTDRGILIALDEDGGFSVKHLANRVGRWSLNNRRNSGVLANYLRDLERRGLVAKLDDQRPIAWKRTAAGTEALEDPK